ncbi:hypothetical protein OROGR_018579 [Orobanche gracilis]
MEDGNQRGIDRFAPLSSPGDRALELHNVTEQPISPKNERIVSTNPSSDVAISGASRNVNERPAASETSGAFTTMYSFNSYTPQEQGYFYGGYNNGGANWDEHSNYVNANNLHVIPSAMYNENSPLFFPPGYGYDSQMAYGQLSQLASPIMYDGQLFSPHHQMTVNPSYYAPPLSPGLPHGSSGLPAPHTDLLASRSSSQENLVDSAFLGSGSGYYLPFGSFGGDLSGNTGLGLYKFPGEFGSSDSLPTRSSSFDTSKFVSPLASGNVYPQQIGLLGSYDQHVSQGFGLTNSSARQFAHGGFYQSNNGHASNRTRYSTDKGARRDRDTVIISDPLVVSSDRNRGPRASKPKGKVSPEEGSSSDVVESTSQLHIPYLNLPEFVTEYEHAKFFVIKSFSEDNIHKSIKYRVWASTPLGNKKLDAAYRLAKEIGGICPVFLFFSVNASGQFCGVSEMVGPVDFENDAEYWHQDRWSGQFPIKWHIIKDVPNSHFRHILLENNDNKPVTHSRDSQEVKLELGLEMLKIFKGHDAETSLLDDFDFYDEREKSLMERKTKQRSGTTEKTSAPLANEPVSQLSDNLAGTLRLDGGKNLGSKSDLV